MENVLLVDKLDTLGQLMFEMKQLEDAFQAQHAAKLQQIADLKEEVKAEVLTLGRTAETLKLRAELRRGSTRWDTKFLEGYVLNHPELYKYKREGKPTVAFILKDEEALNEDI